MFSRRSFWKIVGAGAVGAPLAARAATGPAEAAGMLADSEELGTSAARPHPSFAALRRIRAGVLNVGYAEAGPAHGPAVVLLHGWPYDIHSYADVAPLLAAKGYRVIVPYLRGYGTTRFLSPRT
ncbi:alpha/beta fold hydrolase, partial [Streptomyces rubiginosohelvolus]